MSYPNPILNPISYVYVWYDGVCSDGLGVRVEDSLPRGQWFISPLEQFVLKTRAINSILRNRNMIGKIPTWWENSDRGNRKTVGKNSAMVGGRKKVFRCRDHLVLRHPSYMRGFTYPFSLSAYCNSEVFHVYFRGGNGTYKRSRIFLIHRKTNNVCEYFPLMPHLYGLHAVEM
jgi:hypothetical protein